MPDNQFIFFEMKIAIDFLRFNIYNLFIIKILQTSRNKLFLPRFLHTATDSSNFAPKPNIKFNSLNKI